MKATRSTTKKEPSAKNLVAATAAALLLTAGLCACTPSQSNSATQNGTQGSTSTLTANDKPAQAQPANNQAAPAGNGENAENAAATNTQAAEQASQQKASPTAEELFAQLDITQDFRDSFFHGTKTAEYQKYIMLHDTEGEGSAASVVNYWDGNGSGVAAHFIVNKDGSIVQCVQLDAITHHAGFGNTGHNEQFGIVEDGRDDMAGTVPIGSWASDYGMNAWSIGIEMVHVGGTGYYPEEQLEALDKLIAYIDAYYGFQSQITDHKAWRSGNSDTSPEFEDYLANYQDHRTHN